MYRYQPNTKKQSKPAQYSIGIQLIQQNDITRQMSKSFKKKDLARKGSRQNASKSKDLKSGVSRSLIFELSSSHYPGGQQGIYSVKSIREGNSKKFKKDRSEGQKHPEVDREEKESRHERQDDEITLLKQEINSKNATINQLVLDLERETENSRNLKRKCDNANHQVEVRDEEFKKLQKDYQIQKRNSKENELLANLTTKELEYVQKEKKEMKDLLNKKKLELANYEQKLVEKEDKIAQLENSLQTQKKKNKSQTAKLTEYSQKIESQAEQLNECSQKISSQETIRHENQRLILTQRIKINEQADLIKKQKLQISDQVTKAIEEANKNRQIELRNEQLQILLKSQKSKVQQLTKLVEEYRTRLSRQ